MTRNQVTALLRHGRIRTTEAKAKELRRWVERVITSAKPGETPGQTASRLLEEAILREGPDTVAAFARAAAPAARSRTAAS